MSIKPFTIDIPPSEVSRLHQKLKDTRLPSTPIVPDAGEDYGPPLEWTHRLYNKWLHSFSWSKTQAHLNRHKHFIATIPDESTSLDIHFTHTRSTQPNAIPLLLVHGWPGSFHEFDRVVDAFASPAPPSPSTNSPTSTPSFHVIVPSLPGFCWSSPPPRRKWTMQDTARVFDKLMHLLGYPRYVVQAGDRGHFVGRELGAKYPGCLAVHFNFAPSVRPDSLETEDLTDRERFISSRIAVRNGWTTTWGTRPVGILMWVGEKYAEVATQEHQADPDEEGSPGWLWDEAILTTVCLYYFTGCIMTSMLPYYENMKHAEFGTFMLSAQNRVEVPMAYSSFLYDTRPGYRRGVERTGNLVYYSEHDDGGHFAALECPETILRVCREFFGEYVKM